MSVKVAPPLNEAAKSSFLIANATFIFTFATVAGSPDALKKLTLELLLIDVATSVFPYELFLSINLKGASEVPESGAT